jgi:fatty-acyl-CoA synthase
MIVPLTPLEFRQRAVSLYGSSVGIVDGEQHFTYSEYDRRINRFANALLQLGARPKDTVSFITYNCHQLLEAYYAIPQINAILNPINIRLAPHEIEYILNHAGSRVLCFHKDFLPLVAALRPRLETVVQYLILEPDEVPAWAQDLEKLMAQATPAASIDLDNVDENAVVELFYTSGTTALPKGVALTNRSLYLHTLNTIIGFQVTDTDTFLHVVPLFHVNGWGTPHFLTAVGGKHVILRKIEFGTMLRLIETEKVTKLLGVPTIFNSLLQYPELGKYNLSSLRECFIGGAPSSLALIETLEEKLGCRVFVGYGLTEASPVVSIARAKPDLQADTAMRQSYQVKTGLPIVGVSVRVVDEAGDDVPRDETTMGEILVRSNHVMQSYFKDQKATDAVLADGWLHTGDMAVIDPEGYITIVDRKKDVIISGGENISSVEVEQTLQNHPAVYEVVVIGVPDETWGEVAKALIVLKPNKSVSEAELIAYGRQHLAHYKVPKSVEFRENLPKGGTGKILKRELRLPYWQGYEKKVH